MRRVVPVSLLILLPVCIGCGSNPTSAPATFPTRPNPPITINLDALKGGAAAKPADGADADARELAKAAELEIGLALHSYHDQMNQFPTGVSRKSGVGLSWRVQLLPQLKQEDLYKQFKLDEPWDSETNKKLVEKMPAVFASPGKAAPAGQTYLRSFVGPAAFLPVPPADPKAPFRGRFLPSISDGTSNTLMVAEATEPVIWTKPDDLPFDGGKTNPKAEVPKLGGPFADGFHGLMADGKVLFFPKDAATDDLLRSLLTIDGGEVIDLNPILKANGEKEREYTKPGGTPPTNKKN